MVQTGAPDFQQYEQWTDLPLFNGVITGAAIPVTVGTFNVSQWAYLQVFFNSVQGAFRLTFNFSADAAGATRTGIRIIDASTASGFQNEISIPCLGRFVQVLCTSNVPLNPAATITLSGSNRAGPTVASVAAYGLLELTGIGIGGGASLDFNLATLFTGPVHVSYLSNVTPMLFQLHWKDNGGTVHPFHEKNTTAANVAVTDTPIYVPPAPCILRIINTSGGPGAFNAYVMSDAYRIGS